MVFMPRQNARMRNSSLTCALAVWLLAGACGTLLGAESASPGLVFACAADNDLYAVLAANGVVCPRYDSPAAALAAADNGAGVLLLADGYPHQTQTIEPALFDLAASKRLRLYVEYPTSLPGLEVGAPRDTKWERGVVTSDAFGHSLRPMRIVAIHDCHFVPLAAEKPHLVLAKVAGFDTALYGLPAKEVWPVLFEMAEKDLSHNRPSHVGRPDKTELPTGFGTGPKKVLVSTTKLSQFVTARYAPTEAWRPIWRMILAWLQPGMSLPELKWTPAVRPSYTRDQPLPSDAERQAIRRGNHWVLKSRMLIHPSWRTADWGSSPKQSKFVVEFGEARHTSLRFSLPPGDGTCGILEGFQSKIRYDGSQAVRWSLRTDCSGEHVASFVLAGKLLDEPQYVEIGKNLADFVLFTFDAQAPWNTPSHPAYGLIGWACPPTMPQPMDQTNSLYGVISARVCMSTLAAAAVLDDARWDDRALQVMLANFRTTGRLGFRETAIRRTTLEEKGWQYYYHRPTLNLGCHPTAQLLAANLMAYKASGYRPLLERTEHALRLLMEAYPDKLKWWNGLQQERGRLLLPLAWLVRAHDTPEHRAWLDRVAGDFLKSQDACGAVREELGSSEKGVYGAPASNEAYGTKETSLIQNNGDPVCCLLYTLNSGFLGLHEAAAATGDPRLRQAEDRMAAFLCRIQTQSEIHPDLDGTWFRAFDFGRWDYWASNADLGWGAWCVETGWVQGWLVTTFALRQLQTSLWDLTTRRPLTRHLEKNLKQLSLDTEPES